MYPIVAATEAGATMGEIAGVMRTAHGFLYDLYRPIDSPVGWAVEWFAMRLLIGQPLFAAFLATFALHTQEVHVPNRFWHKDCAFFVLISITHG